MTKGKARYKGTPVKQKIKHSQSARDCDCFKDSLDKNAERNYILSYLTKPSLNNQDEDGFKKKHKNRSGKVKNGKENKEEKHSQIENNNDKKSKKTKSKKNALKKANSVTLKRNRIVPLNDGSGKSVIVSQWTTIKEAPCEKEEKKPPQVEKTVHTTNTLGRLFARLSLIRKKAHNYLTKKRGEKEIKEPVGELIQKPFVEFEKIPLEDDYLEETFQEQDESEVDELKELSKPNLEAGRLSVCSSVYFTPLGRSPESVRRNSGRRQSLVASPQSLDAEEFGDAHSWFVGSDGRPASLTEVDNIRTMLDNASPVDHEELRRRLRAGEPLYPHSDSTLWLRSCEKEIVEPLRGTTTGMVRHSNHTNMFFLTKWI